MSVLLEFSRDAMACRFEVLLHPGQPEHGPEAAIKALDTISFLDNVLSVYKPTSELSLLNERAHREAIQVSQSTGNLIQLGLDVFRDTEGGFDMTAAKLTKIWGFYRRQGHMPNESDIHDALQNIGSQHIGLDHEKMLVYFDRPLEINPGGIGKGYAIDCAASALMEAGVTDFAFHGGKSSLLCRGNQFMPDTTGGWRIAVRHPEITERILGTLILKNQALGTSGPANQFFYHRGKRYGHIIDPRTGWPAEGMLSVSILHSHAGWADALATGLYVLGVEKAVEYCRKNPHVGMLAILPAKQNSCEVITCNIPEDQWIVAT